MMNVVDKYFLIDSEFRQKRKSNGIDNMQIVVAILVIGQIFLEINQMYDFTKSVEVAKNDDSNYGDY